MRGGKRIGAGRKKGSANKASAERAAAIAASGLTPLNYLLSVMRDVSNGVTERLEAAKAAAPFVHPKLSAVTVKGELHVRRIERVIIDPEQPDATERTQRHAEHPQATIQ